MIGSTPRRCETCCRSVSRGTDATRGQNRRHTSPCPWVRDRKLAGHGPTGELRAARGFGRRVWRRGRGRHAVDQPAPQVLTLRSQTGHHPAIDVSDIRKVCCGEAKHEHDHLLGRRSPRKGLYRARLWAPPSSPRLRAGSTCTISCAVTQKGERPKIIRLRFVREARQGLLDKPRLRAPECWRGRRPAGVDTWPAGCERR